MSDSAPQPVERRLPTEESRQLIELVRDIVSKEITPRAAEEEEGLQATSAAITAEEREAIIEESVRQVLKILKKSRER